MPRQQPLSLPPFAPFVTATALLAILTLPERQERAGLDETLVAFAPLVGKSWRGRLVSAGSEQGARMSFLRIEAALDGKALRVLHALEEGASTTEAFLTWDAEKKAHVYFYFTNAGFFGEGRVDFERESLVIRESAAAGGLGVPEMRARGCVLQDGRLHVRWQYLREGAWSTEEEAFYTEEATRDAWFAMGSG